MFLIVGTLIGLNLAVRVGLGEVRERQEKGYARLGRRMQLGLKDVALITAKSAIFLVVPVGIGVALDLAFGSSIGSLFE